MNKQDSQPPSTHKSPASNEVDDGDSRIEHSQHVLALMALFHAENDATKMPELYDLAKRDWQEETDSDQSIPPRHSPAA